MTTLKPSHLPSLNTNFDVILIHYLKPQIILPLLVCIKLLLIPSYKSTDFDVHRNWLAITSHFHHSSWYFEDIKGKTIHTLDYPPLFALFEYFLSSNFITKLLTNENGDSFWYHNEGGSGGAILSSRCLELLPDNDNDVGYDCIIFQRTTVIVFDVIFWLGAWVCSRSLFGCKSLFGYRREGYATERTIDWQHNEVKANIAFALIVCQPGMLLLDHVHFQYNGVMLGFLLGSIGFLIRGCPGDRRVISSQNEDPSMFFGGIHNNLMAALLFAALLMLKHLYITLAPIYFFYLLRHYCYVFKSVARNQSSLSAQKDKQPTIASSIQRFSLIRFAILGLITASILILPLIPFLVFSDNPMQQLLQMQKRLFPFNRGLTHDYWAGNIWAIHLFLVKVLSFVAKKLSFSPPILFELSPKVVAVALFLGLIPGMICAWKCASKISLKSEPILLSTVTIERGNTILYCIVFSGMSSFMLGYHVHEKAIMTALIPMSLLSLISKNNARIFLRMLSIGNFGLLPLLYRPVELCFKIFMNIAFLGLSIFLLKSVHEENRIINISQPKKGQIRAENKPLITQLDILLLVIMSTILFFAEAVHPFFFKPHDLWEFLPLMLTSLYCALGLLGCWIQCGKAMFNSLQPFDGKCSLNE